MKKYLIGATAALLLIGNVQAQEIQTATETRKEITWPELNRSYLKTGDFVSISALKSVGAGMSYDQVRLAIGNPHFSEGLGRPSEFNYAFNFYTNAAKTEWITCQYQVTFNKERRVDGRYWREPKCAAFLNDKPAAPAAPAKKAMTLSSDGMFAFGRSGMNDLQQTGRDNLDRLANQMLNGYSNLRAVEVIGHTDRIGSVAANNALSQARANTVKAYFANRGIPAGIIRARGVGSSTPVNSCAGAATPAVIACLLPNRRVEVIVSGDEK